MLTRAQIQRMAQRNGIGVQTQERDYIQHLLLFLVFRNPPTLIFKGGTALRIVYKGVRYSEDLDFNAEPKNTHVKGLWQKAVKDLHLFGVNAEIRYEWQSEAGYSFDVSYQGPLYDGRDRTKGKVRVDINLRHEMIDAHPELVTSAYDDLRPFVVTVISREHLMAEKIRALFMRGKARDVYDIWLLMGMDITVNKALVGSKLAFFDIVPSKTNLDDALDKAQAAWIKDLKPLLPQVIPWSDAFARVYPALSEFVF
jgi:predicted nucleotidyltransferase component of viral defense system